MGHSSATAPPGPGEPGQLTAELERALVRALRGQYDELNATFFKEQLERPVIELANTSARFGQWAHATRTLEVSRTALLEHGWGVVVEVLKHEMAHQFVDEVLECRTESAHGPEFRRVCAERGFDARAAGVPEAAPLEGDRAKILDRIAKLLALAESPNLHEAQSAMNAAQRLMLKHNIESVASGGRNDYGFRHLGKPTGRVEEWARVLAVILGDHFFVQAIWVPVWRPLEGKRGSVLEVCGTPENLEIAEYVYSFLQATAERLWKEYQRDSRISSNRDRRSYIAGVMSGFREKLNEQRTLSRERGLVWVGDAELDGFFHQRHPYTRTTQYTGRRRGEAHAEGRAAGRSIVLHRGVGDSGGGRSSPALLPARRR